MIYGPLYELEPQLNEKGYTLAGNKELANKLHFGLNVCHIHGILSDGEYKKALGRLNKWIGENAVPQTMSEAPAKDKNVPTTYDLLYEEGGPDA